MDALHLHVFEWNIQIVKQTFSAFIVMLLILTGSGQRSVYTGVDFCKRLCSASVIRSGESMENALWACCKGIKIGKILIHREGDNKPTGNSAVQTIWLLLIKGVPKANIIFLNLISVPQGVHAVCKHFPRIKIVTSEIETG
ncbi:uridine kinase-like 4 [Artemisia annua]|uniref:Uridine kinase-like 4 n=1 Tax=Artemisia annua TaxID=35608 RepID=A0A2U1L095_ARTAN|nr:uridine kinase-like 4 [Artemisia annua]